MGLDMYAHRRHYVKQWDHESPEKRYSVRVFRGGKPVAGLQTDRISSVDEEVMEWRKANQIHGWFVDNVQSGVDDCGECRVKPEKIRELLEVCEKVIAASKLVDGMVANGYTYNENRERIYQREPGKVIEDATVAKALLPTREGCFFGLPEYDEWYSRRGGTHARLGRSNVDGHQGGIG